MNVGISKVTIFACSPGGVLVFDHPTAGVQFPAGTVDAAELPAVAAIRELQEETGVVVEALELLSQVEFERTDGVHYTLADVLTFDGTTIPRGYRVDLIGSADPQRFARVEYDYNVTPPLLLSRLDGEAPSWVFSKSVVRSFFLAETALKPTWSWPGDDGHVFRCRFAAVDGLKAFGEQEGWLDSHREIIRARVNQMR